MAQFSHERIHNLKLKMDELSNFLHRFTTLTECHLVDFITHDFYETLLPPNIGDLLFTLSDEELAQIPDCKLMDILIVDNRSESHSELIEFLRNCRRFSIEHFSNDTDMSRYFMNRDEICRMKKFKLTYYTDEKKSHEIAEMASAVATLSGTVASDIVVDIGSGRGYLGSLLALYYGLRVFGFDASDCNTHSANKRLEQVRKDWKTTIKHTGINVTDSIDGDDRINGSKRKGHYQPITCSVSPSTSLNESLFDSQLISDQDSVVVCGLHTCGDLAAYTLKMYLDCVRAKGLLLVGCCYHLIEEQFAENPFRKGDPPPQCYGFPLSSYFRKKQFGVGRNSRILSSQPVSKMSEKIILPNKALFWRALLQQIVWEKLSRRIDIFEQRVGRIAKKCMNFKEYLPRALRKLGINIQLTDVEIQQYEDYYGRYERKLAAFFQFRCALAQPIETAVLLDRLCYLLEQECVEEAKIIALFDPTISPRCYAILAKKR